MSLKFRCNNCWTKWFGLFRRIFNSFALWWNICKSSNFVWINKKLLIHSLVWTQGQEVKFHEIEIHFFMRSKLNLFMRSKFTKIFSQFWSGGWIFDHEIEIPKSIIRNFDLMIDLLVPSTIMRSKFKINYINLVSCTCG